MAVPNVNEKRQHPRVVVTWPVVMKSARGFMAGETKDVSYSGAFIRCREPLQPKETFEISISVSLLCPRVKATAEVVWSNPSNPDNELKPRGMGVRFTNIADTDRELISALVLDQLKTEETGRREEESME